jgi:hypothetical protein
MRGEMNTLLVIAGLVVLAVLIVAVIAGINRQHPPD